MKKITLITCLLLTLQAHTQTNPQYGPNDCLVLSPGSCPVDFLKDAFCYRDESICFFLSFTNSFRFYDSRFLRAYGDIVFPDTPKIVAAQILASGDEQTLHEIFEFSICLVSPDSCYNDGASGLTIYHTPLSDECPPSDDNCHGGPSDSRICQVTPEACTLSGD